jgi:hypothetical protein
MYNITTPLVKYLAIYILQNIKSMQIPFILLKERRLLVTFHP